MNRLFLVAIVFFGVVGGLLFAGPKGTITVPRISSPITIDGDFSDWPLTSYKTIAQQPIFPDAQGVGVATGANGDHLVWDVDRVGPFNGTDLDAWSPDNASEFGSSVYFAYDDAYLYVLGVFIDDELNGFRSEDGLSNFLNDGFEIFIDPLGDSDDLIAENAFPTIDAEDPNFDDFQFTFGLNDWFEPEQPQPGDIGAEVHIERAGDQDIVKVFYQEIRELDLDFSSIGGRDVAARSYDDLRAAGAQNPEVIANPDETFTGYAAEFVVPFGLIEEFKPEQDMGFALFWRDVDDEVDPQPGFGGGSIFWTDWSQNTETSGAGEDGNLFHAGNWGELVFGDELSTCNPNSQGDIDGNGKVEFADFLVLSANFGADVSGHADGDIDCNGTVEFADFLVLSANFGQDVAGAAPVPEPSTAAIALTLCGCMLHWRRRRV